MASTKVEIRCFCRTRPLLGIGGRDSNGKPYVHVKTWKGSRLYAEVIVTDGIAHIRCRGCLRWHTIRIVKKTLDVEQEKLPETLSV